MRPLSGYTLQDTCLSRQHLHRTIGIVDAPDLSRMTIDGRLFEAARNGAVDTLATLLDEHPDKLNARARPYEWSLLHYAAHGGHLSSVDLLLSRGLDVNIREQGDNTYPMHWAAAAGHLDVVRRLGDAGGDVVGHGDDHELEVIGWATCWNGCDDAVHRAVVDYLVARGAQHHIFSAIALNLADEVGRIVSADPSALARKMSHNEDYQLPLHFAVRMNRPQMVALLVELGADPLATDGSGYRAAAYATTPDIDRPAMVCVAGWRCPVHPSARLKRLGRADRWETRFRFGTTPIASSRSAENHRLRGDGRQALERV